MSRSMGSHHSRTMKSDTWLTPRYIVESLGTFYLDPCTPSKMPWLTADSRFYLPLKDGLKEEWIGRVWLNPPYSNEASKWLEKLAKHGNGIALVFARTETRWFVDHVWNRATGICFLHGRVTFCDASGVPAKANSGAPSCLVAYGQNNWIKLKASGLAGSYVEGWVNL